MDAAHKPTQNVCNFAHESHSIEWNKLDCLPARAKGVNAQFSVKNTKNNSEETEENRTE